MSDYKVGYGKPPKQHRFKKGQPSANPHGRPKGRKATGILAKLDEKVVVDTKNGRRVKRTLREVVDHNLVKDALAGDKHSRTLLYRVVDAAEKDEATQEREAASRRQQTAPNLDPDEARRKVTAYFRERLASLHPLVDEAIRLGLFELEGTVTRVAAWARKAAEDRHVATGTPKLPYQGNG